MTEADLICQQMALIRHNLHKDVSEVRGGVEQVLDWKSLPRRYPIASVVASLVAGYAIVPRGADRAKERIVSQAGLLDAVPTQPRRAMASRAVDFLWPIAEQAIQAYAAVWIEGQIRQYKSQGPSSPRAAKSENGKQSSSGDPVFSRFGERY